jgi:hypothetical protein
VVQPIEAEISVLLFLSGNFGILSIVQVGRSSSVDAANLCFFYGLWRPGRIPPLVLPHQPQIMRHFVPALL